ncbi:3'-5' exonuclease [Streptomyces sp. NPDC059708]|uniref:3'-5' exonuclease n=1 Tax=Streptomyces sp. NPDC059708 TaxID=3346916 RepID=UPI0036AC1BD8
MHYTSAARTPGSRNVVDPTTLGDQFAHTVDAVPAHLVRPADTTDAVWVVYEDSQPLGAVSATTREAAGAWRIQTTGERLNSLDDAVRALRRPRTWSRDRAQAADWARRTLADSRTLLIDLETTGLDAPYAVQIAAVDTRGNVLLDTLVNPVAPIEEGATAVHGISAEQLAGAPQFAELLPRLTDALTGRHCVAYQAAFDRDVWNRETARATAAGYHQAAALWASLTWADAMAPYAAWRGLWHAGRGTYRSQRLGGSHQAADDCLTLLSRLEEMAGSTTL